MISRVIRKTSVESGSQTVVASTGSTSPVAKAAERFNVPLWGVQLAKDGVANVRRVAASAPRWAVATALLVGLPFAWLPLLVAVFVVPFWTAVGAIAYALYHDWTTLVSHVAVAVEEATGIQVRRSPYLKPLYELVIRVALLVDQIQLRLSAPFRAVFHACYQRLVLPLVRLVLGPGSPVWPLARLWLGAVRLAWRYAVVALKWAEKLGYRTFPTLTGYVVRVVDAVVYKSQAVADSISDRIPLQFKQL